MLELGIIHFVACCGDDEDQPLQSLVRAWTALTPELKLAVPAPLEETEASLRLD